MRWLEGLWHEKFAHAAVRGEWFLLESEDVSRFTQVILWNRGKLPLAGRKLTDPWYILGSDQEE